MHIEDNTEDRKELYHYQKEDIDAIFEKFEGRPDNYHLLYQLPTGGGKTVIFSEIARRYIEKYKRKVLVLTHRIELSKQTSQMLKGFGVKNKVIDSNIKDLPDHDDYSCYVAMVETLNNRLKDKKFRMDYVGLVIVDEAHYNSFRKLFSYFKDSFFLGVTATPLSSNIDLPMYETYNELIVGEPIQALIKKGYLAKAIMYGYDVELTSLKLGINGDYTVSSSDELYSRSIMQDLLLQSYENRAKGKKTLIFNNGINTSLYVYETFKAAGYTIKHLDNKTPEDERKKILTWFKNTPDAIVTSVSILTTGFDEPTVETIILNRATRSLTLYFQMIGRGSRKLPNKDTFTVIDLGNNAQRFGLWSDPVDWHYIFKHPEQFLENIRTDSDIESHHVYVMPDELRNKFKNTPNIDFDIEEQYTIMVTDRKLKPKTVIEKSIRQHAIMCIENTESIPEARKLAKELEYDIEYRVKQYAKLLAKTTKNYRQWLMDDYKHRLNLIIGKLYYDHYSEEGKNSALKSSN
ncbi:DEAD/DEAH box helicase [Flavobacterium salilacus subsp. salilacus]|uniref:DEAD/DEAH box helicase n=1 Tax=Flavobacterium TaxID=237 RepID=UPI0010756605|nr:MULTISPECIES: DEAD/DEAH box helicase [Flavobacterium]KAF2519299.1 DEAD/DEAH box helicase [Flavobacterium salilacus subsp. salilacus]MBE1613489.1 DEAD/DEAH box helicase [Flavobacterium sp. SaA2.13]